ncbi:MAG: SDR family NAD(P)-dependent oxidoreductase [Gammaproteobacteria bacterium]
MSDLYNTLLSHAGVIDAYVMIRHDSRGCSRRVAYVAPSGNFSAPVLMNYLRERLPDASLPDALVPVARLPLDASGQIDVAQLARVPVIDEEVLNTWEKLLAEHKDIGRAAVFSAPERSDTSWIHLDDLFPDHIDSPDLERLDRRPVCEYPPLAHPGALAYADGGSLPPLEPGTPEVCTDALLRAAKDHGDNGILTVDKHGRTRFQSYAELADHALRLLAVLQSGGMQPGSSAILHVPDSVLHFQTFWACMLGGIVPVTVAIPPTYDSDHALVRKLVNVADLLGTPVVLTEALVAEGVESVFAKAASNPDSFIKIKVLESVTSGPCGQIHQAGPDDVAFYQLSSGSTGTPKCIQETHAAVIAHIRASILANDYHSGDVTLNWLPFDHVVPTLTFHLKDVFLGCRQIHVETEYIVAEPLHWLDWLQDQRVTRTWAPNFAFKMLADAAKKRSFPVRDLTSVRSFMNAGEMVTLPAIEAFLSALGPSGVKPTAIQPSFGMAEACTCITYNNAFDLKKSALRIAKASLDGDLRGCEDEAQAAVPDWFFRPVWQAAAPHARKPALGCVLVFTDRAAPATALREALGSETAMVQAYGSDVFKRTKPGCYAVPADPAGYRRLLDDLSQHDRFPDAIVIFRPIGESGPSAIEWQQVLIPMFQAIIPFAERTNSLRLLMITRGGLPVMQNDEVAPEHSVARALAAVASEEIPGLSVRHLDLSTDDSSWVLHTVQELLDAGQERVVAWRDGQRLVPGLSRYRPQPVPGESLERAGAYLVTGGLGGIGMELARFLLGQYDARLLIVGRTPAEERAGALRELSQQGLVVYSMLDVADAKALTGAVSAFEHQAGRTLSGIFHLAGVFSPKLLTEESPEHFSSLLHAKTKGARALASLLESRPDCAFYAFSSINAYFGGLMVAAYCAANLFLESLVHELRRKGRHAMAFSWSIWDDSGMNAGNPTKERLADLGYRAIAPTKGIKSMLACIGAGTTADSGAPAVCLIGLDAGRARIAREIVGGFNIDSPLIACIESPLDVFPLQTLNTLRVTDSFGTMVPADFRHFTRFPENQDGTIDRKKIAALLQGRRAGPQEKPSTDDQRQLVEIFRRVLGVDRIGIHDNFFDLGGSSLLLAMVQCKIREEMGHDVDTVELFRFPSVYALARRLSRKPSPARKRRISQSKRSNGAIAVIGMSCRFPMAPNVETYWQNLMSGRDCITHFEKTELLASGVSPELLNHPSYVCAAGILDDIDRFAATFFGCSAAEAEAMDPQHRLFMECAWEVLESAGYASDCYAGNIGVFAGTTLNSYSLGHQSHPALDIAFFSDLVASDREFIATRLAYKLDLRGQAVNVQSACSTGLVAIHLACQSLLSGDSDLALAGAASIRVPHRRGYFYQEGGIFSPDGRCRPLDAGANGTVFGNGVGVVLLKPVEDALRDGDPILAVVRGTAVNNDGSLKVGFTAPCQDAQVEVIRQALDRAGLKPSEIDYVEAHGTGTGLGDPIEVAALADVFNAGETKPGLKKCLLGSVKPNVGHLDAAAGMAGFIKTVLMLSGGYLVPTLHFQRPNPKLILESTPFRIAASLEPWKAHGRPLRVGVSAFGISVAPMPMLSLNSRLRRHAKAPRTT